MCRYEKRLEDMLRWKERRGVVVDILFMPNTLQDKQKERNRSHSGCGRPADRT
jgi:hypothetical protein